MPKLNAEFINDLKEMDIEVLDLTDQALDDEDAQKIAEVLKANKKITRIFLGNNNPSDTGKITDKGAILIAKALSDRGTVELDISNNKIGMEGARALAKLDPRTLIISGNILRGDLGFLNECKKLDKLRMSDCGLESSQFLNTTFSCRELDVSSNALTDEVFSGLSKSAVLSILNARQNKLRGRNLELMAGCQVLVTADFSNNQIENEPAKKLAQALEKNKSLKFLNLSFNTIGPDGIAALSALKTGLKLLLDGNPGNSKIHLASPPRKEFEEKKTPAKASGDNPTKA